MEFWTTSQVALYCGDARNVLSQLPNSSVDCVVTSPPYYGQRDYGSPNQLGLETTPFDYIENLILVFQEVHRVLKNTGSVWVNLGDTYWSGKGTPTQKDAKNPNRRFSRPQDKTHSHPVCKGKQLLLIPQRFAIAMQEDGWIVRNEVIWAKTNPTPDPVGDRLAVAHEQFYFFTKESHGYYFNREAIALPRADGGLKNASSVWQLTNRPTFKKHIAPFQDSLIEIPLRASLPPSGVVLDPFCGSATVLKSAISMGEGRRGIGIDVQEKFLHEAVIHLSLSSPSSKKISSSTVTSSSGESNSADTSSSVKRASSSGSFQS
jgi:site-specific DNA-methyltransferase (adenine-specific)